MNTRPLLSTLSIGLALAVGAAAGYFAALPSPQQTPHSNTVSSAQPDPAPPSAAPGPFSIAETTQPVPQLNPQPKSPSQGPIQLHTIEASFQQRAAFMQQITNASYAELEQTADAFLNQMDPHQHAKQDSFQALLSRMVDLDASQTTEFITSNIERRSQGPQFYFLSNALQLLGESNYTSLLEWSKQLSPNHVREEIQTRILAGFAKQSPEDALELAKELIANGNESAQYSILNEWTKKDAYAAMDWLQSQPASMARKQQMAMVFSQWSQQDLYAAEAYLVNIDDPSLLAELNTQVMMAKAQDNPQLAVESALTIAEPRQRNTALRAAIESWGYRSGYEAIDYVTSQLSGDDQALAYRVLSQSINLQEPGSSQRSPQDLFDLASTLPSGIRESLQHQALLLLTEQNPQQAIEYVQTITDANEQNFALQQIAWTLPRVDMALAESLFEQSDEETRSILAMGMVDAYRESDPDYALQWFQQMNEGEVKQNVGRALLPELMYSQPDLAIEILNGTQADPGYGHIDMFFMAHSINPDLALEWLDQAQLSEADRSMIDEFIESSGGLFYHDQYQVIPHESQ